MTALRSVVAAWALLTIVPLPTALSRRMRPEDWSQGAAAFPLIGLALGCAVAAIAHLSTHILGPYVGATVAVVAGTILTAGLHLDGLADCADALGARGSGESQRLLRLEILRDSATGAYGTLALTCAVLLQVTTIATLWLAGATSMAAAIILATTLSRTTGLFHVRLLPSARPVGLGAAFRVHRDALAVAVLTAAAVIAGVGALWAVDHDPLARIAALAASVGGGALAVALTTSLARRRLGGHTGDTIGATIVVTEVFSLLGFLVAS